MYYNAVGANSRQLPETKSEIVFILSLCLEMWPQCRNWFVNFFQMQTYCTSHYLELIFKWTKLLTFEMIIFGLKMMVKSGLPANQPGQPAGISEGARRISK